MWSSASTIAAGISPPRGCLNDHLGPAPRGRDDIQCPSGRTQALLDTDEAEAARAPAGGRRPHVEAHPVVLDGAPQEPAVAPEPDADAGGLRMPGHVGERLLD